MTHKVCDRIDKVGLMCRRRYELSLNMEAERRSHLLLVAPMAADLGGLV